MKTLNKLVVLVTLSLLSLAMVACKPEQAPVEYTVTSKPVVGPDDVIELLEDQSITFEYSIASTLEDGNRSTVDLSLVLHAQPKHGVLTDCNKSDALTYTCKYTPNPNFSGVDEVLFKSKDGDFITKEASKLTINVLEVYDKPEISDIQVSVLQGETLVFDVPLAQDPDSAAGQILYEILDNVAEGELNCFKDSDGLAKSGVRTCSYTAGTSYFGDVFANYSAKDETDSAAEESAQIKISIGRVDYSAEETFAQGQQSNLNGVDITWVVDNSGSMSDEQTALQQNLGSFINNFLNDTNGDGVGDQAKFPFNMIVTSTEAYLSNKAKFRTPPNSSTPYDLSSVLAESNFNQFKTNFEDAVLMGINGSGSEKALASADALYQAKSDWYGGNNRISVYIILSDEPEQSNTKTAAEWAAHFQALKDEASKTKFYPIIRLTKDNGNRYADIANLTGGQVYDITQPFDQILNNISLTVSNLIDLFGLNPNRVIIENSIKVYIDEVEQTSGWTFQNQAIKFDTDPPAESTIKVTYRYYNP